MSAESFLELYTTLFGWQQYNNLWTILSDTGIVFIPFLFILAKNFIEPAASLSAREAGGVSLRRMEIDTALALSVVVLAAQPTPLTPLNPSVIQYENPCNTSAPVDPTSSGTTYDETFDSIVVGTNVPIWWYAMLSLSGGITHAAINGIGCVEDISGYRLQINKIRIADPTVMDELGRFMKDCYIPARSKYYADKPNVATILTNHGIQDPEWFGAYTYRQTAGYYDTLRASGPVKGWTYRAVRDTEYNDPSLTPPSAGRPYCKEWYEHGTLGIRSKLLDEVPAPLKAQGLAILSAIGFTDYSSTDMEDDTLKSVVTTSLASAPAQSGFSSAYNDEGLLEFSTTPVNLSLIGAGVGTAWEKVSFAPMMYAVRSGAPIVQALILLAIYMLLPIALVISSYSWNLVVTASIAIFTIKFWAYLWHIAKWMEDNLMRALYPDGTSFFAANIANLIDGEFALKTMLIEMATATMFIGLPIIFATIMAWGGYRFVQGIANAMQSPLHTMGGAGRAAADTGKARLAGRIGK